jgi:hypothetical protein
VEKIKTIYTDRVDKVLELVGSTQLDSVRCAKKGGTICQVSWVATTNSDPRYTLPTGATYGLYGGGQKDFHAMPLQGLAKQVADSTLPVQIDETIRVNRNVEQNTVGGKIVMLA